MNYLCKLNTETIKCEEKIQTFNLLSEDFLSKIRKKLENMIK